tara:strand:+ start:1037 stop:1462 length:426 start_codon:yes stop_codon:yes gene_type:complete
MILGYTTGVFDLFHVGHVNLLRNARGMCDKLVVGVTTDELVSYKNKKSVISFEERMEVVRSCCYVDAVIPQQDMDKFIQWQKVKFDVMFVGDDWFNTEKWEAIDQQFKNEGVRVVYFPYTKGTSSTLINNVLLDLRKENNQ